MHSRLGDQRDRGNTRISRSQLAEWLTEPHAMSLADVTRRTDITTHEMCTVKKVTAPLSTDRSLVTRRGENRNFS